MSAASPVLCTVVVQCCMLLWCFMMRSWLCCLAVWCGVLKALLPEGKARDVYPQVQVNGRVVCVVHTLCASVFSAAESGNRDTWRPPTRPLLLAQELPWNSLPLRLLVQT